MKLSTKGRYGVKAMLDLALHSKEGHVSLKSIAERQELSENYLEQLFAGLKKAGLVRSLRGAQGGYTLSADSSDITIGAILRALEGSLAPVDCAHKDGGGGCCKADECVTKFLWDKISDSINSVVDSMTLKDLIDEHDKIKGANILNLNILDSEKIT